MVQLVYSPTEIINDTVEAFAAKQEKKKELQEQYKDTPISKIPVEDLALVLEDKKVSEIPESVRPAIMNYLVQKRLNNLVLLKRMKCLKKKKRILTLLLSVVVLT